MQNLVEEKDKKVKELQDNIAAVSFTPSSKMGKMLMAKCRTLQEENEEIGNQAAEGKVLYSQKFTSLLFSTTHLTFLFSLLHHLISGRSDSKMVIVFKIALMFVNFECRKILFRSVELN